MVVNTLLHIFYGRSLAPVQQFGNCHAGRIVVARCMRLLALSRCVCEKQEQARIFFSRLINCYCSCRKLHVDQPVSTEVLVPRRRSGRSAHCWISKPKSATDGANGSPVLMDSSSGGGARDDADVVATGVVSRGEGGAGAGSDADVVVTGVISKGEGGAGAGNFADVVATGVVNGLEDCEGAGIDMDGVFSDDADWSGLADWTLVHAPIFYAELRPAVRKPVLQHHPSTLHGIGNQGVS